jgi:hypothetical protein
VLLLLLPFLLSLQVLPEAIELTLQQVRNVLASHHSRPCFPPHHLSRHIRYGIYHVGFTSASTVGPTFKSMGCSLAIFTDDLLNGNVTLSGTSFFTGLNLFSGNLGYLGGNLTNIKNNLTDLSNLASGTTYTQVNNIQTAIPTIKNIPDNAGVAAMNLNYNTPISASPATGTLASSFNSILGTWSTSKTLVSNLYVPV